MCIENVVCLFLVGVIASSVNIEDTNEEAPIFDMTSYSSSLMENVNAGAVVIQVSNYGNNVHHDLITVDAEIGNLFIYFIPQKLFLF